MTRLTKRGRVYRLDGVRVPSVTTVLDVLAKPALVDWAAKQSAAYAVEHWSELSDAPVLERAEKIAGARFATVRAAAEKGDVLHRMAERLQTGEATPPPELLGPVEAIARMLDAWDLHTVATEAPCASTAHAYAGTLDSIMTCPRLGTVLVDWKSGGRVYSEVALQLVAYRSTDLRLVPRVLTGPRGGKRIEHDEAPMPAIDGTYVAHILPDAVRLVPVRTEAPELDAFLYARELWEWIRSTQDAKSETYDPPLSDPIDPDDFDA